MAGFATPERTGRTFASATAKRGGRGFLGRPADLTGSPTRSGPGVCYWTIVPPRKLSISVGLVEFVLIIQRPTFPPPAANAAGNG